MTKCVNSLCILVLVTLVIEVEPERILFLLPLATKSHMNFVSPIIRGLAQKGYDLDVVSPGLSPGMPTSPGSVRDIVPISYGEVMGHMKSPIEMRKMGKFGGFVGFRLDFLFKGCHKVWNNQEFQNWLGNSTSDSYDLIFINGFMNHCFNGILKKLDAPFIQFVSMPAPLFIAKNTGNDLPFSFVPNPFLPLTHRMTFLERMLNFAMHYISTIWFRLTYFRETEAIYKQYLGQDLPSPEEIESDVSMIMQNSHFVINYPRPLLPDVIEIGGIHCQPAKPLPVELDEFLREAPSGFIFFSFGSIFRSEHMSEEIRTTFLRVFAKMKERVLWKWDGRDMNDLPPNVQLITWAPQQDILGHSNIKLFISHGGLLSTQEATYHGVPILGIPLFGDQDINVKQAELGGYALKLEILDLSEELLTQKLTLLLNDEKYRNRAKELSEIIRDELHPPLDKAIFYSEYIMRHKGARHMRSPARELNYFQYHSWDVIGFLGGILLVILITLKYTFKFAIWSLRKLFSKGKEFPNKKIQ